MLVVNTLSLSFSLTNSLKILNGALNQKGAVTIKTFFNLAGYPPCNRKWKKRVKIAKRTPAPPSLSRHSVTLPSTEECLSALSLNFPLSEWKTLVPGPRPQDTPGPSSQRRMSNPPRRTRSRPLRLTAQAHRRDAGVLHPCPVQARGLTGAGPRPADLARPSAMPAILAMPQRAGPSHGLAAPSRAGRGRAAECPSHDETGRTQLAAGAGRGPDRAQGLAALAGQLRGVPRPGLAAGPRRSAKLA